MLINLFKKKQEIKKIVAPNTLDLDSFFAVSLLKYLYPKAEIEFLPFNTELPKEYIKNPEIAIVNVGSVYNPKLNNFSLPIVDHDIELKHYASATQSIIEKFFKIKSKSLENYAYLTSLYAVIYIEKLNILIFSDLSDIYRILSEQANLNREELRFILNLNPSYEIGKIISEFLFEKKRINSIFNIFHPFSEFIEKLYKRLFNELIKQ